MRKIVFLALMLLAVVGAIGSVEAAKPPGGGSVCSNPGPGCACGCECGQLLKCCTSGGVTTCQPVYDPNWLCPQIACI